MQRLALAFILALFGLTSCAQPEPALSPSDEKLASAYSSLLLLHEQFKSPVGGLDSAKYQVKIDSLLHSYGITQEELSERLTALAQSTAMFQLFQARVRDELRQPRPPSSNLPDK